MRILVWAAECIKSLQFDSRISTSLFIAHPAAERLVRPAAERLVRPAAERLVRPAAERLVRPDNKFTAAWQPIR